MAIVRRVITLLAAMVTVSCGKPHPVQPTPSTWPVPEAFKTCKVLETVRWGPPKGGWTVTLYCPDGWRLVSYETGKEIEFVPKSEIDK